MLEFLSKKIIENKSSDVRISLRLVQSVFENKLLSIENKRKRKKWIRLDEF